MDILSVFLEKIHNVFWYCTCHSFYWKAVLFQWILFLKMNGVLNGTQLIN